MSFDFAREIQSESPHVACSALSPGILEVKDWKVYKKQTSYEPLPFSRKLAHLLSQQTSARCKIWKVYAK